MKTRKKIRLTFRSGVFLFIKKLLAQLMLHQLAQGVHGGGLVAAVWHFAGQPFGIVPFWPGCGTGLIVLVVLTLCNGKKVSDDYALYKSRMDAVPAEEL